MPQGQYTFGPPAGGAAPPPVDPGKPKYSFGPPPGSAPTGLNDAIAGAEGAKAGDNNPGNLSVPVAKQVGSPTVGERPSTGVGATDIAKFASPEVGKDALTKYLSSFPPGTTIEQLGAKYAPGQPSWVDNVSKKLGVSKTATLGSLRTVGAGNTPAPADAPSVAPPKPPIDRSGIKPPDAFSRGVTKGIGLDPKAIEMAGKFQYGDKLYARNHPMVNMAGEAVKEAAKGMGTWMNAVYDAKTSSEALKQLASPLEAMARVVEFHTGQKWDAFGLHKAGVEETAIDQIAKGYKSGSSEEMKEGAGRLVGGLAGIFASAETPEAAKGLKELPGKISETVKIANEARKADVVTAAANNALHVDVKTSIVPAIARNVKAISEGIARDAQAVVTKDKAASVASGTSAFKSPSIAQVVADAVKDKSAEKAPLPQTRAVLKSFVQVIKKHGQDMSWEDLKDMRSQVYEAMQNASLKDKAVLGQVYDSYGKMLADRAKTVGATDEFERYSSSTQKLRGHKEGILSTLQNADTGLKTYQELAKASNKPALNDFFHLGESYGGVPASFVDEMVKTRRPIFEMAKRADAGESSGGRMSAIMRHPYAAGTAMVGTGAGLTMMSPIPITGSFVASLVAAQKVANFMDRFDAVKAMRAIKRTPPNLLQGMPTPFPGGASQTPPQAPPPTGPAPTTGAAPSPTSPGAPPTAPTVSPSGPAPTASVGVPAAPASLEGLMDRIKNVQKMQDTHIETQSARGTSVAPVVVDVDKLADKMQEKGIDRTQANARAAELADKLAHPEKHSLNTVKQAQNARAMYEGPERRVSPNRAGVEARAAEGTKSAKQTPYEEFGVKIDKTRLTTPEAVRTAKLDAKAQLEELGRARFTEASKMPLGPERKAALAKLDADVKKASRSIDKMQTPEVSRKQRDVLRKAIEANKVGPKDRAVLEGMNPEQVEQMAAKGVTDDQEQLMEMIDLGRRAEEMGGRVKEVYNKIYNQTGGDPRTSLPMLRALFDHIDKATKKPAAE